MEELQDIRERFPIYIYNTLHRKKELFEPLHPERMGMYVCGPTVYGDPHLGHARSAITFDLVFRYFSFLGYKVRYVRNITDVGHLEDEVAEQGEDKIAKKARLEQLEPMEIVQRYTNSYHSALDKMNILRPSIEPTATGHIVEQIKIIQKILDKELAYVVDGSVYFDLEAYQTQQNYGQLSGKVLEDLISGSRGTEGLDEKRNPHDFALWKKAKPEHIMRWDSPWGEGFPGWHLECTTMSTKYLGAPFDIHGGGMDLQFPHHECEIAQAHAAFGQKAHESHQEVYARYWIHNNMVTLDKVKMSKSKGNFITLEQLYAGDHDLLEQPYTPMTVRFFMLQAHYGSIIDFSNEALQASEKAYKRLMQSQELLDSLSHPGFGEVDSSIEHEVRQQVDSIFTHLSDDFNTAKVIASLFDLTGKINQFYHGQLSMQTISADTFNYLKSSFRKVISEVLGLVPEQQEDNQLVDSLINMLIDIRKDARGKKDYATSDKIRDELHKLGVQLKDEKTGETTFAIQ